MRLFIAEKPSVAKVIAQALNITNKTSWGYSNANTSITSCFGHLLKLNEPDTYLSDDVPVNSNGGKIWRIQDLPIIPSTFKKTFADNSAKDRFFAIKELLNKAKVVINAGDPDREGQLLIDEVIEACNYKGNVLRYWSAAMDQVSVKRALDNLQPNNKYYSWGRAAEARSRIDWLIGMNLSRALTLSNPKNNLYVVGRVQTPLLKLINDRNEAIKNFKSINHFKLKAILNNSELTANFIPDESLINEQGYILDKSIIEQIANQITNQDAIVQSSISKNRTLEPPLPYTLTDLQSDCAKDLKLSPKETLEIAQSLYEKHKLISYPRSSCPYLPSSQKTDVEQIFRNIKKDFSGFSSILEKADHNKDSSVWNDKAVDKDAHTAIIPTVPEHEKIENNLSENELNVFSKICKRFLCCFLPNHSYTLTSIKFDIKGYAFEAKIKSIIENGFKNFISYKVDDDADTCIITNTDLNSISSYKCTNSNIEEKKTIAPKRFTQGSIIKAMRSISLYVDDVSEKKLLSDTDGLGTEATRAAILDSLFKRKYITLDNDYLYISELGANVLNKVPHRYKSISLTASCESNLEQIKNNSKTLTDVVNIEAAEIKDIIINIKKDIEMQKEKCIACGSTDLWRFKSKFGNSFVWRCNGCNCYYKDNEGKQGEKIEQKDKQTNEEHKEKCIACGSTDLWRFKSKFDNSFVWRCNGCNNYFKDNEGKQGEKIEQKEKKYTKCDCPLCSTPQSVGRYPSKYKQGSFYWYCSSCKKSFFDSKDGSTPGNEIVSKK